MTALIGVKHPNTVFERAVQAAFPGLHVDPVLLMPVAAIARPRGCHPRLPVQRSAAVPTR